MRDLKNDPLARVRDDTLSQLVVKLDRMIGGLSDLQAETALRDEPAIQYALAAYCDTIRCAADFLCDLRYEKHRRGA